MTRESLHAALLAADSATAVLERFFGPMSVQRLDRPESHNEGLRDRLCLLADDILRHRAVHLLAGDRVISQAELWYVANRLPADRTALLDNSDIPFGRIMQPLGLKRVVLLAELCAPDAPFSLAHRASLALPSGQPVAEVYELYSGALFTSA